MDKLNINQWAEADRPRERLLAHGAGALSDAELLAILIGSGSTDESAVALMRRILDSVDGSLKRLGRLTLAELCNYKGIGTAKAVTLMAACELSKRRAEEAPLERLTMDSASKIYHYFLPKMQDLMYEECHVLLLNHRLQVLESRMVSSGGISSASVDIRRVLHYALVANASAIALCHNHPSGTSEPSISDDCLTDSLRKACEAVNLRFVDHIVLADGNYYSYTSQRVEYEQESCSAPVPPPGESLSAGNTNKNRTEIPLTS